ncbi:MAG: type II toxin-antitoxin system VapC family toxin [Verrucomicrobiae bacterium]|nr:type II toxin-antitoxin system VapC family toxin [Verrucomicrobiae bacterium]
MSSSSGRALEASDNELILSAASVWELGIKAGLGRLKLPGSVAAYVGEKVEQGLRVLSVDWTHAAAVEKLPSQHGDPFDRLLAAQSLAEKLPLVTGDRAFRRYGVQVIW